MRLVKWADALVTMKDELTRQEKAKEEMIHNISHDLKTPIATIKSYSESIKDGIYPYGTLEAQRRCYFRQCPAFRG